MSCYHPLVGWPTGEISEKGKPLYHIEGRGKLGSMVNPEGFLADNTDAVLIPCGRCIGCRLDYSRKWADRMMLELAVQKKAIFVTLTYDNEHIPIVYDDDDFPICFTLKKEDVQLWMKRVRRHYGDKSLRFYLAGEYGSSTGRPHYHCILYGLSLDDFPKKRAYKKSELNDIYYIDDDFAARWNQGYVVIADVSWKTCAYVARYVTKKVLNQFPEAFEELGMVPEFSLMSRRPGIGKPYLDAHPDCLDLQSINISTPEGGRQIAIPKYYLKQLELTDPKRYASIIAERKMYAQDANAVKLFESGRDFLDHLEIEEQHKRNSVRGLSRSKV